MKSILAFQLLLTMVVSACISGVKSSGNTDFTNNKDAYRILRLDSVNDVYVIYSKKNDSLFKIVSQKESFPSCDKIKVNEYYNLKISSLFPRNFNGYDLSPQALPHVEGIDFYGTTIVLERDSINDLFSAENLRGLCFINE